MPVKTTGFYMNLIQFVNSHVRPAVVPRLRFPVLWAQTDSQLESSGEHHVGHHPQQTCHTEEEEG